MGFYGSNDPTNSVEALKEERCWRIRQKIRTSGSWSKWLPKFNPFFLVHTWRSDQ